MVLLSISSEVIWEFYADVAGMLERMVVVFMDQMIRIESVGKLVLY